MYIKQKTQGGYLTAKAIQIKAKNFEFKSKLQLFQYLSQYLRI